MIYLELFLGFLKVGCFAFGGAYGAIPLIRDVVMQHQWLSNDMFTYMVAVSESTPGPIMVNLATYIGSNQAGLLGSIVATLGVVLPSFIIVLLIMMVLKDILKNKYGKAILQGLKPCVIGIVLATGVYMIYSHLFINHQINLQAVIITFTMLGIYFISKKKKPLAPTTLLIVSAVLGMIVYGI